MGDIDDLLDEFESDLKKTMKKSQNKSILIPRTGKQARRDFNELGFIYSHLRIMISIFYSWNWIQFQQSGY